jgi:hypothetical protein
MESAGKCRAKLATGSSGSLAPEQYGRYSMLMTLAASPPLMINDQIDGKAADGQLMIEEQTCDGYIVAHANLVSDRC